MGVTSVMAGLAFVKITMDNAELKTGVAQAQTTLKGLANSCVSFSNKMIGIGAMITPPIVMAVKAYADFDDQMRLAGSVSGATGKQFSALTEQAKKLGRETSFTAAQVAGGMTNLGKMGFKPKEIEQAIAPMMNLSRATGTDLPVATDIAAAALRMFKMEIGETAKVADLLTATANASSVDVIDLGESLKMAGPQASAAGESLKDVNVALGVMGNLGIKGSLAGTALRKAYSQFANTDVQDYLKEFSIRTVDANGNIRKMKDIIIDLSKVMQDMGTADRIAFAEKVFDIRGSLAGLSLTADVSELDKIEEVLNNSAGLARKTAAEMDKGIGGVLRRMLSSAEGVSIAFGQIVGDAFGPAIKSASLFGNKLAELIKNSELLKTALGIVGVSLGLAVLIKTIQYVSSGIKTLLSPLLALDKLISGYIDKSVATAQAEKLNLAQKETAAAREIALEKEKTANALAATAARAAATAKEEAAKLQALVMQKNANDQAIAESARVIAAKRAETAAVIAAEEKKIAASTGKRGRAVAQQIAESQAKIKVAQTEASVTITAEIEKQAAIAKTNVALANQIAAQNGISNAAGKSAIVAAANSGKAAAEYSKASAAVESFSKAESALAAPMKKTSEIMVGQAAHLGNLIKAEGVRALFAKSNAAAVSSANLKTLAASLAASKGIKTMTAAIYAQAAAIKVCTVLANGFRAALTALAKHPFLVALTLAVATIALIEKKLNAAAKATNDYAKACENVVKSAEKLQEKGLAKRQSSGGDMERLQQLSEKNKLTAEEMAEAEKLIGNLYSYGSSDFSALDKINQRLDMSANAQKIYQAKMKGQALDHNREMISAQEAYLKAMLNQQLPEDQLEDHAKKIQEEREKLQELRRKHYKIMSGDQEAITGNSGTSTRDRIEAEKEKRIATAEELKKASEELAKIDEANAKKKLSQIEQEIYEIDKLKKEYEKYAQTKSDAIMAEMEANRAKMKRNQEGKTPAQKKLYQEAYDAYQKNQAELRDLDNRAEQANKDFNEQKEKAITKNNQEYKDFIPEQDKNQKKHDAEIAEQRKFDKLMKDVKSRDGQNALQAFVDAISGDLGKIRKEYLDKLKEFEDPTSSGGAGITEEEGKQLEPLRKTIEEFTSRLNSYRDKIADGMLSVKNKQQPTIAGFDMRAILAQLGSGSAEERTAKATESIAQSSRKTNLLLEKTRKLRTV